MLTVFVCNLIFLSTIFSSIPTEYLDTLKAVARSRNDWDVKPQHKNIRHGQSKYFDMQDR